MKIKNLFFGVLAIAAIATGCQEKALDGSNLMVDKDKLDATKDKAEYVLNVTADCEWKATTQADWFTVEPAAGKGNGQVTVYVNENAGAERSATLHFQKTSTMKVSFDVTVAQAAGRVLELGDGTLAKPYLASQAADVASQLADGATTPNKVYVKGYVKKFASKHAAGISDFGNALFYITDGPDFEGTDFYCYQVYYLGGKKFTSEDQIKIGDEVIVYGQLTNYNGTYETVGKGAAYCYSINGQTEGGDTPDPTPVEAKNVTVAEFNAAEVSTSVYYRLTGTVGSGSINTTYGNFDLVDETGTVYVYGLDNIADVKDKLVKGAKITVTGTRGDYNGKIEMLNGHCEKIEAGDAPEPIVATDATVAEFIAAANPDKYYRLRGKVGGSINTTYGNFDLTDATGTVYVYGLDNIASVKDKLLDGADIVITGTYYVYQKEGQPDKIEVMNGHCESIAGGEPGPAPTPGTGTFDSNVVWTLGTSAYDQNASINGEEVEHLLKLGTSSKAGDATITIPAGTVKVTFYGLSWNAKAATCVIKQGANELFRKEFATNAGVSGNPKYTITGVTDSDKYTIELGAALTAATEVSVTTDGANTRVILFGIKAE